MKPLSDEDILKAFDGDFGTVSFAHKPTQEDIFLIKLNLVARKAEQERGRQIVELLEKWQRQGTHLVSKEAIQELKEVDNG